MNKKQSILILGSSGFLGSNFLLFALKNGYDVTDILRFKNKNNKNISELKKKYKNYKSIFYKEFKQLKKIKERKFDFFINFATFYSEENSDKNLTKFVNSNILFPVIVLNNLNYQIKKIINFGSMQEFFNSKKFNPKNLYASSKKAYSQFLEFYKAKYKDIQFYDIKLYDTFSKYDRRNKIFPTIINCYFNKKKFYLINNKLNLNVIHADNINEFIIKVLKNKSKINQEVILRNEKNINILNLIENLNKKLPNQIQYEIKSKIYDNKTLNQYQNLRIVKIKYNIEKDLLDILKNN